MHFNINDEAPLKVMTKEQSDVHVVGVIFTQHFSLKKGLELFGDKADIAVQKELTQIHKMNTYEPVQKTDLTFKNRKKALAQLMFTTKKRNGDTKARRITDGSKQRTYDGYDKSDCSLPAAATDSIFLSGVIGTKNS